MFRWLKRLVKREPKNSSGLKVPEWVKDAGSYAEWKNQGFPQPQSQIAATKTHKAATKSEITGVLSPEELARIKERRAAAAPKKPSK